MILRNARCNDEIHVYIKFSDPQRMQAILTADRGFSTRKRRNLRSSKRGSRIRNATSEGGQLTPGSGRQVLESGAVCIWWIPRHSTGNMAKCLSLSGFRRITYGEHVSGQIYPFVCGGGRVQSANIIRGAADNLLQQQRTGSSANYVPAQTAERAESRPATTASWAEVGQGGPFQIPRQ